MSIHQKLPQIIQTIFDGSQISKIKLLVERKRYYLYSFGLRDNNYITRIIDNRNKLECNAKIQKEKIALEKVAHQTEVPVPKVIFSDPNVNYSGYSIIILEKLDGIPLNNAWHFLSNTNKKHIARELAGHLNEVHHIPFDLFGDIIANHSRNTESWSSWVSGRIQAYYNIFSTNQVMDTNLLKRAFSYIQDLLPQIRVRKQPILVHNDLNANNILIDPKDDRSQKPKITGIIDWEMSFAGIEKYDLINLESLFFNEASIISTFLDHYPLVNSLNSWDRERKIYQILNILDTAIFYYRSNRLGNQRRKLTEIMLKSILRNNYLN